METQASAPKWGPILAGVIGLVGVYALGLVFGGLLLGDEVFDRMGFGPDDGEITGSTPRRYLRLLYGILGAVLVGWMVTLAAIVVGPLRRREPWAWWTLCTAVMFWFVLDTGLSLVLGFGGHALFNVAFVAALAIPLVSIKTELRQS